MQKLFLFISSMFLGLCTFAHNDDDHPEGKRTSKHQTQYPSEVRIQFSSLQEVFDYADEHAAAIQSAAVAEQIAIAEKKEANSYLLPSVDAAIGYNDNIKLQPVLLPSQVFNPEAPEGTFEELTFGTRYSYSLGLQAQWDVLNFQRIFAAQTAGIEVGRSKSNTDVSKYNTYNLLASTYYSILLTQESIYIYEENLEVAESLLDNAEEKYKKGLISEAERNRAEIKKLQNQMNLDQARHNLDQFYIQLQSQLNTSEPIYVTDTPETFALETTAIDSKHPDVVLQEAEVKKYQSMVKQQKAFRLPSVSLVYQNNLNWATNNFMDFSDVYELPQQSFGIMITVPLGRFSTRHKTTQAKLNLQLQQDQLEYTKLVTLKEDELLHVEVGQASGQLAQSKQILNLQQQNDIHAENQYQSEIVSLDNRLDKYDDLLAAQDNYLQSLAAFTLAQYKLYIRQIDFQ